MCIQQVGGQWHLTSFVRTREIHAELVIAWAVETGQAAATAPSESLMRRIISVDFKFVRRPIRGDWGLCTVCDRLKKVISTSADSNPVIHG